jgi:hypothetical protein
MFDWLLPETHAIAILKKDHDKVKDLFDRFEKAEDRAAKSKIIKEALLELKVHAAIEEEIFYPAVRKHVGKDQMNEADEEHHVAKLVIAELENAKSGDDHRDAKFTVLSESVRHHIREEENEMLPKAKEMNLDFERLGAQMLERKRQLLAKGVPEMAEEKLMRTNAKADSPARAAKRKPRAMGAGRK